MMAQKEFRPMTTQIAKSGTSRPLRKRKMAMVDPAHSEKKNGRGKS
jgi:hypothetical protein